MDNFPPFDDVSPFKELLSQSLKDAIIEVNKHFKESGHRYDVPGLFAKHIRSVLHDKLEPEATSYEFSIDTSAGSFLIFYKQFVIKLYKAYNGMLPQSRHSKAWRRFMNYNSTLLSISELPGFEGLGGNHAGTKVHLVTYYEVNADHEFLWLRIACPRSVTSSGIACIWNEVVEASEEGTQSQQRPTTPRPDIPFFRMDDSLADVDDLDDDDNDSTELGS